MAKREGTWLEATKLHDDFRETRLTIMGNQRLPIRPAPIFKDPFHEPGCVLFRIDHGAIHVPKEMIGQSGHGRFYSHESLNGSGNLNLQSAQMIQIARIPQSSGTRKKIGKFPKSSCMPARVSINHSPARIVGHHP